MYKESSNVLKLLFDQSSKDVFKQEAYNKLSQAVDECDKVKRPLS